MEPYSFPYLPVICLLNFVSILCEWYWSDWSVILMENTFPSVYLYASSISISDPFLYLKHKERNLLLNLIAPNYGTCSNVMCHIPSHGQKLNHECSTMLRLLCCHVSHSLLHKLSHLKKSKVWYNETFPSSFFILLGVLPSSSAWSKTTIRFSNYLLHCFPLITSLFTPTARLWNTFKGIQGLREI